MGGNMMLGKKARNVIKKLISWTLLFFFTFTMMPAHIQVVRAEDEEIKRVTIRNIYNNYQRTDKIITIQDIRMQDWVKDNKKLSLLTSADGLVDVTNLQIFGSTAVQANINTKWNIQQAILSGQTVEEPENPEDEPKYKDEEINYLNINESNMPEITSVETPLVDVNDEIIINGSNNLHLLSDNNTYTVMVGSVEAKVKVKADNQISLKPSGQFAQGIQDIIITKKATIGSGVNQYDLEISFVYKNAVRIAGEINLDGVTMFPSMGEPGSDVRFTRETLQEYDIYFISDLNNPQLFTEENMAKNFRLVNNTDADDVITAEVPDVPSGQYHIVFTNPHSQQVGVNNQYVYKEQQFSVIRISQRPSIESVQPNEAISMEPTKVTISGYYFVPHNVPGFTSEDVLSYDKDKGIMNYGTGELELGGKTYENVTVTRKYTVNIGRDLKILDFEFDPNNLSTINRFIVETQDFNIDEEEIHDVIIRMETTISGGIAPNVLNITMVNEVSLEDGFTYLPSTVAPKVTRATPSIIPIVSEDGDYFIHPSMGELLIAIEGDNFLVTRYFNEKGLEMISKPIVRIGGVDINPNLTESNEEGVYVPLRFEVLKDGKTVDGTPGNETGDTILIWLKTGTELVDGAFPVLSKDSRSVTITNPRRGSNVFENPFTFNNIIRFEEINDNDFPIISSVQPSLVAVEGGVSVVITGSNLRTGAKVYIDGKEVSNVQVSGDNQRITFIAPPGRPGVTQLQVINPEGGIATHPFTYTATYTEPRLIYINPTEGTNNTLVTVKGENFLRPDPTVVVDDLKNIDEFLMYRLIGTRILMDGHDINKYNRNSNNQIELVKFIDDNGETSPYRLEDHIFVYRDEIGQLELGKSFNSVLLVEKNDDNTIKFYRIVRDIQNNYIIEDGLGGQYIIQYHRAVDGGEFRAVRGSYSFKIEFPFKGGIKLVDEYGNEHLSLTAYTPFLIEKIGEYHEITGNRVEYVNSTTLNFSVPLLAVSPWTGPGYYDVTVINPDIKSETIKDAFRYYASPVTFPVVKDVIPDQGPDIGGNIITFILDEDANNENYKFVDTGTQKTKVFIGGQQVPADDVEVSFDGREIQVRVPAYQGDIKEMGTDRITVPIVLVNPDGGTFSISYDRPLYVERSNIKEGTKRAIRGYTYVVPTSNPTIEYISPVDGGADGGYIVEIFGSDFRDFEPFTDLNGNFKWDEGEPFTDLDGDGNYTKAHNPEESQPSRYNSKYEILTSMLLPKVYFGNKEAEIVEFNYGYLQVVAPPGVEGTVDLYVVNNDAGISNSVTFTYTISHPEISSIVPNVVNKAGGDRVEILGKEFAEGPVTILSKGYDSKNFSVANQRNLTMVKVGDRTNKDLPRNHENSGVLMSGRATVRLSGGLTVHYNSSGGILNVSISLDGKTYEHEYRGVKAEPIFINTKDLRSDDLAYPYEELIRVEIVSNRLLVDAGYAPEVNHIRPGQLIVTTPAYYTVGEVNLYVINPDGSVAEGKITYVSPDSKPYIINITRDGRDPEPIDDQDILVLNLDYRGGNVVSVIGGDFREGAIVQISDILSIPSENVQLIYELPSKLTFTMPEVSEDLVGGLYRVTVINEDGGSASSDELTPPIYIRFIKGESYPEVLRVIPNIGPAKGGTQVIIEGKDFREDHLGNPPNVFFGEVQVEPHNVTRIDYKTLRVITPPNIPGTVSVRVENYDGAVSNPSGIFHYISSPTINVVVDPNDPTETKVISNISVEGGQRIKLKGAGYETTSRVIFSPEVRPLTDDEDDTVENVIYIEGIPHVLLSGQEAAAVEYVDSETLIVITPEGRLGNTGIIVINEDRGASNIYKNLAFSLPELGEPTNVVAELVYDRYIRIHWDGVNGAREYEIYAIIDGKPMEFIATTELTDYLYTNLEPRTSYRFVITAVGNFGSSKPSLRSNLVSTGRNVGYPDTDGSINENTQITRVGSATQVSVGTRDYDDKEIVIDMLRGELAGTTQATVSIPASVVTSSRAKDIVILGRDFTITFNPRAFNNSTVQANRNKNDAGIRFEIKPINERLNLVGGNDLSKAYELKAQVYIGADNIELDYLNSFINFTLDYDANKAEMRRLTRITLNRYNSQGKWEPVENTRFEPGVHSVTGITDRLGRYIIIGSR